MDHTELGHRIRYHRQRLGLTQMQLSEIVGVSYQQIQKYERGSTQMTVERLLTLARGLRTRPAALVPELDGSRVADVAAGATRDEITVGRLFSSIKDPSVQKHILRLLQSLANAP